MTRKTISDAVTTISAEYIEKAADFHVKKKSEKICWGKWIAAAACVCLVLMGILQPSTKQPGVSPFVLTAYALENDNSLSSVAMQEGESVPVSLFETNNGLKGFVFSHDCADTEKSDTIAIMSEGDNAASIDEIVGLATEQGKQYYFYIPAEGKSALYSFPLFIADESTNTAVQLTIVIEQNKDGFTAKIDDLTVQERKEMP